MKKLEFYQKFVNILPNNCQNFAKETVRILSKKLSEFCDKSIRIFCQNFVIKQIGKIGTKAQLVFLQQWSVQLLKNQEKRDKKSWKKYWWVFCIPRPDATKSHLAISQISAGKGVGLLGGKGCKNVFQAFVIWWCFSALLADISF
jgi:hypothetical protein